MQCSLRGHGTPQGVAEDLALHAARRCRPPLPSDEALAIVRDVFGRYPTNGERMSGLSQERVDVLAVLWTAATPLSPSQVARILARSRGSTKKLLAAMCHDIQVTRVSGRYIPNVSP